MMPMKSAQWDLSGVTDSLKRMGGQVGEHVSGAGASLMQMYRRMDPEMRSNILRTLMGAGVGATTLGISHAMSNRDPEESGGWVQKALLGALLGGGAAYALPAGLDMLRGRMRFPGETTVGPLEAASGAALGGLASHPGATIGGLAGGGLAYRANKGLLGRGPTAGAAEAIYDKLFDRFKGDSTMINELNTKLTNAGVGSRGALGSATREQLRQVVGGTADPTTGAWRSGLKPDVRYNDLFKRVNISPALRRVRGIAPKLDKIPRIGGALGSAVRRIPTTGALPLKPVLKSFMNIRDPRVKLLAAVLGGVGLGTVGQKAIQGSV